METSSPPSTGPTTGASALRRAELSLRRRLFAPPPRLTISEWADRYRMLSRGASAEPGKWRTDRAPYQRGIMDAISDPTTERVAVMSSVQVGKTEIVLNGTGYYIDQDPAPILVVQPTVKPMAESFSKDRLAPMLRDSAKLRGKVRNEQGRRHSEDTILHKVFPGGHITIVGANSAAGLASRPIRVIFFDEVDRYPASAGTEGDPVTLGAKRTSTFWNRKIVLVSSPTIKGVSRIEQAFLEGDQRHYEVPCPVCTHYQPFTWAQLNFSPVGFKCRACEELIDEVEKPAMLRKGRWVPGAPDHPYPSFHLNAMYSPWATWTELITEFHSARKSPERLQVFTNTVLAETWEATGEEQADPSSLGRRREEGYLAEVPDGVGVLTAGVDVQKDRLELLVVGWGEGQESWIIKHERLYGDPEQWDVWERLDAELAREWQHAGGAKLRVRCTCVDSGSFTSAVYRYVRPRQLKRGIFATKGSSQRGRPVISRPQRPNKYGVRVVMVGVDTAKDSLFRRLKVQEPGNGGYVHFPKSVDDEFLDQFGAEVVRIRHQKGVPIREYHQVRERNEAIDLSVLTMAALHLMGAAVYDQLGAWAKKARDRGHLAQGVLPAQDAPVELPPVQPDAPGRRLPRPRGGGGWVNRW